MAKQWYCKPCHLLFSTAEALEAHREEQRREGVAQHILCNECGEQLVDTQHEFAHLQKVKLEPSLPPQSGNRLTPDST